MKKFLFLLGVLIPAVLAAICLPVSAAEVETSPLQRPAWPKALESVQEGRSLVDAVADAAQASYVLSQHSAGRSSFQGWCGLYTSHQLYNLGINKTLVVNDGNMQFDYYSRRDMSSGGYYITSYPSEEYTLEEALNSVSDYGNKDVFNILVGFQWTHTTEGAYYGHAVIINGIVDGYLYFIESYPSSLGGPEGTLLTCTIPEFVEYFDSWTLFDGIIHFGQGTYSDVCPTVSTDLTVQARFQTVMRSQPAMLGKKESQQIRVVQPAETFRAIAICRDTRGQYYKVLTEDGVGYISANALSVIDSGSGDMVLEGLSLPQQVQEGKGFLLDGSVSATYGRVASLEVLILDGDGRPVRRESVEVDDRMGSLSALNHGLWTSLLEPGVYSVQVSAYSVCPVADSKWGQSRYGRTVLYTAAVEVGVAGQAQQDMTH